MNRPTKRFLAEYYHDGSWWGCDIHAYDHEDAEARAKKLGNLKILGERVMSIPCVAPGSWLPNWIVGFLNWFRN